MKQRPLSEWYVVSLVLIVISNNVNFLISNRLALLIVIVMAVGCKGDQLEPLERYLGEGFTMQKVLDLRLPDVGQLDDGTEQMSRQLKEAESRTRTKHTIKYKNVIKDWGLVKIYSNRTIHLNDNAWKQYSSEIRDENNELKTRVLASSVSVQLGDEIVCGSSEKSPYEVK